MAASCPSCKSVNLDKDDDVQVVCMDCGFVLDDSPVDYVQAGWDNNALTDGKSKGYLSSLPSHFIRADDSIRAAPAGSKEAQNRVNTLCSVLSLNEHMTNECKDMMTTVYTKYRKHSINLKLNLASGCVYLVCRLYDWPVRLMEIASLLRCDVVQLGRAVKLVERTMGMKARSICVDEMVPEFCNRTGIEDPAISDCTMKIIQISKDVWLAYGCAREPVLTAALYLAWQSADCTANWKVTLRQFCSRYKIDINITTQRRLREIKEVLMKLVKEMPWMSEDSDSLSDKKLCFHIEDIIEHKETLLQDCYARAKAEIEDAETADEDAEHSSSSSSDKKREADTEYPRLFTRRK